MVRLSEAAKRLELLRCVFLGSCADGRDNQARRVDAIVLTRTLLDCLVKGQGCATARHLLLRTLVRKRKFIILE